MRHIHAAAAVALSILSSSILYAQANPPGLSITNYHYVSEEFYSRTQSKVTYRADLTNNGPAQTSVTATLKSTVPDMVILGKDVLRFSPVPANSVVTSNDTFTILVNRTSTFSFNSLQWTLVVASQPPPIANAGPNQSATVGKLVTLNGSGSSNPSGVGTLTYSWVFTSKPAGSSATLSNPTSVMPTFTPDVAGNYVVTLTVSNGTDSARASTTVSTTAPPAPVANAGPDQSVLLGSTVVLNGSASTSGSGKPLTYAFSFVSVPAGSTATLTGANTVSPTFVADKNGDYIVQLIVNDGIASSAPATVKISTQVVKPTANAGPNQTVNPGSVVQLTGAASSDPNGLPLTYKFSLISVPAGSTAVLSSTTAVNPTFTADRPGIYVAQLIVNNGVLDSNPATVTITTNTPQAPTANAGVNQTVQVGTTVQLNGSGTDPQNLPLTYLWSFNNKPAGSNATLSSTTVANPTLVPDVPGNYVLQLVVNNGFSNSAPATVTISTTCAPPTANAGPAQNVIVGATVTLNGSASGDVCHDPLTYAFSFTTRPAGSSATLSGANTVSPTFVADVVGTYVVQLIVNNGFTNSAPATVTVNAGPVGALTLAPITLPVGTTANMTVSLPATATQNVVVTLSSDAPGVASVPASVTVLAGAKDATFTVTGGTSGNATITASAAGFTNGTGLVTVAPPGSITLPTGLTVPVGQSAPFAVTLSSPAPQGGVTVNLTSSNTANVTLSTGSVTIAAGQTTPANQPAVNGVAFGASTITATATGFSQASQSVQTTISMTLAPNNLPLTAGGSSGTLTLTLSSAAPAGGLTVNVSSSDTSIATVPAPTVTVAAGSTAATIQVTGLKKGTATITASATNAGTATAAANVADPGAIQLPSTTNVQVGQSTAFPVTLASPAPSGGVTITLVSSDPTKVTISTGSVTIAAGDIAPTTQPTVTGVAFGSSTITASAPNFSNATGAVRATLGMSLTPSPLGIAASQSGNLTLTLTGPAPAGGLTVNLTSSNPSFATVPGSVSVNAGDTTVIVPVTGVAQGTTTISASATNAGNANATVNVGPAITIGLPSNVTLAVGASAAFPITLSAAAPANVTITLTSSETSKVTITPGTVTINAGQTTPGTQPQVNGVGFGTATITASAPGYANATAPVQTTITMGIAPNPLAIPAGLPGNLTLTLSSAAPTGGLTVTLASNNGNITLPGTVTVNAGSTTANIPVTAVSAGSSTITATATNVANTTATVNVGPQIAISLASGVTVNVGKTAPIAVTLSQAAPAGGVTINLASSDPSKATIPSSVTIAAGQTAPAVQPMVTGVGKGTPTITASAAGYASATQAVSVVDIPALQFAPPTLVINVPQAPDPNDGNKIKPVPTAGFLTLSLAQPTQSALTLNLNSSNSAAVTVGSTATIPAGQATVLVPVLAINGGTATITANGQNLTASTTVTGVLQPNNAIAVSSISVGKSLQGQLTVTLPAPAAAPTTVNVTSSDPSKVLLGGTAQPQVSFTIDQGATTGGVLVQALDSTGSVNVTASSNNLVSGVGTVTLTPSGFVLSAAGVNAVGQPFSVGQGGQQSLTVIAARLDQAGNFVEAQQIPLATPCLDTNKQPAVCPTTVQVNVSSSNPGVGTIAPATITFFGGQSTQAATFRSSTQGSTTLSVSTPQGYSQPSQGSSLVANVIQSGQTPEAVTVGKGLEAATRIQLGGPVPGKTSLTITSNDPTKFLLAANAGDPGSTSITLDLFALAQVSPDFYVYGLQSSGQGTYTSTIPGYINGTGTVTLGPSGFVLSGPGGLQTGAQFTTTAQQGDVALQVQPALLNPDNSFKITQALAGGTSVNVAVNSSNTSAGTITVSPVTIPGGSSVGNTAFHPLPVTADSTLSVVTPSGFTTPTQFQSILAHVRVQSFSVTGDSGNPIVIGQGLQYPGFVTVSPAPTSNLVVTLTSNSPLLKLATTAAGAGSNSIQVTIPAGSTSAQYFIQSLGNSGTASYTASAPAFTDRIANQITLRPAGVVIAGALGLTVFQHQPAPDNILLANGPSPVTVYVGVVNPDGTFLGQEQLAGGQPLTVQLTNSNPSVGTIPQTAVIQPGNDSAIVMFTPLKKGQTSLGVVQPNGFVAPTHGPTIDDAPFTSLIVNVQ